MSKPIDCKHQRTKMWEPHLAGARKCLDCEMVYNPNSNPKWHHEPPSLQVQFERLQEANKNLEKIIAKELSENDEFGAEFVHVNILKKEIQDRKQAYDKLDDINIKLNEEIGALKKDYGTCSAERDTLKLEAEKWRDEYQNLCKFANDYEDQVEMMAEQVKGNL